MDTADTSSMDSTTSSIFGKGRGSGIKDFLNSNSLVARFAFVLFIIFIFIFIFQMSINLVMYFLGPSRSPHILNGMIDGTHTMVIPQDPNMKGSIPIKRSNNAVDGLEFTWSVWLFIKDDRQYDTYRHIFHKGNADMQDNGLIFPNNAPGLYITPNTNNLAFIMNTFTNINEEIIIEDIPLNKWVNVIIRLSDQTLDIYVNGVITKSLQLTGVPKQNYGDVYMALNHGFQGNISNLWYFDYALGTREITSLVNDGPNTTMVDGPSSSSFTDYLSLRWYFFGQGDQYNP